MIEDGGKYGPACKAAREAVGPADAVVLIVVKGPLGSGFSVQAELHAMATLPELLEGTALELRRLRGF